MDGILINNIIYQEYKKYKNCVYDSLKSENKKTPISTKHDQIQRNCTYSALNAKALTVAKNGIKNEMKYEQSMSSAKDNQEEDRELCPNTNSFSCNGNQREVYYQKLERRYVHDVYNRTAHHFTNSKYKAWPRVQQFLEELQPGSLVSDIGCGHGKYLGINNTVYKVGCDHSIKLATIAADRSHQILVCDNLNLPYRSDSFDAVISIGVIHHFTTIDRRLQAISELARIVRPGGKIMIYVWALEQKHRKFCAQDVLVPWHLNQRDTKEKGKLHLSHSLKENIGNSTSLTTKQASFSVAHSKHPIKIPTMSKVNGSRLNKSNQKENEVLVSENKSSLYNTSSRVSQAIKFHYSKKMSKGISETYINDKMKKQIMIDECSTLQCSIDTSSAATTKLSYTEKDTQILKLTPMDNSFSFGSYIKKKLSSIFMPGKIKNIENDKDSIQQSNNKHSISDNHTAFQLDYVPGNFAVREFPMSSQPKTDSIKTYHKCESILESSVNKFSQLNKQQNFICGKKESLNSLDLLSNNINESTSAAKKYSSYLVPNAKLKNSSTEKLSFPSTNSSSNICEGKLTWHPMKSGSNNLPVMFTLGETFRESDSDWITTTTNAIPKIQTEGIKFPIKEHAHKKLEILSSECTGLTKATPRLQKRNFSQSSSMSGCSSDNFSDSEVEESLCVNKSQKNYGSTFVKNHKRNSFNVNINLDVEKSDQHLTERCNNNTFKRYYHVFKENELDDLISKHQMCLHIVTSVYDNANWCVVAQKKSSVCDFSFE